MSLVKDLNSIKTCKNDIKQAIIDKGVNMRGVALPGYAAKIGEIVTETPATPLTVTANGTYTAPSGGYSPVTVNVPQSVTGITVNELLENAVDLVDIDCTASSVMVSGIFAQTKTVNLPNCTSMISCAFQDAHTLRTVSLSTYSACLPPYAFASCWNLLSVNIPLCGGVSASGFYSCNNLGAISFPSCSTVESSAFHFCYKLSSVSLPVCKYVGDLAFFNCSSIVEMNLPLCSYVGNGAFYICKSLASISLPEVRCVSSCAFQSCGNLSEINLPKCSRIGNSVFHTCTNLKTISLPKCYSIGGVAFLEVKSLETVELSKAVYMSGAVFGGSPLLTTLSLHNVLSTSRWYGNGIIIDCSAFSQLYINRDCYVVPSYFLSRTPFSTGSGSIYVHANNYSRFATASGWSSLSSLMVSVGRADDILLSFSDGLVYGRTGGIESGFTGVLGIDKSQVTAVSLPNCFYVYEKAFWNCNLLSQVYLPSCEALGRSCFNECWNLQSVNLPACEYIETCAFSYCVSLATLTLGGSSVCQLQSYGFSFTPIESRTGSIYVPASLVDAYKSATNWTSYARIIYPIPE